MEYQIALLKGDGIGPEIVESAVAVLEKIGQKYGHSFAFTATRTPSGSVSAHMEAAASRCEAMISPLCRASTAPNAT